MLGTWTAARWPSGRFLALLACLTAAYFAAGRLGLAMALVHLSASAVWPPAGIGLAAMLGIGYRVWPAVFAGAFLVNVTTSGSIPASLGIAAGNTLEALLGAYLVNRWAGGRDAFRDPLNVLRFAALAALLSTIASATVGVATLYATGLAEGSRAGSIAFTWWIGDAVGDLVVAPALLLATQRSRRLDVEALLVAAAVALTGVIAFGGWLPAEHRRAPMEFICIPPVLWAAFRFGPRETAFATLGLSIIAIAGTLGGAGPFPRASDHESLLILQAFVGVVAVMSLAVAAVVDRHRESTRLLRITNERVLAAHEEAEEANRVKDHFLATLSHELRTPLNAITGWTQMLRAGMLEPDEGGRALDVIHRNAQRQNQLISDMLDVSRIMSGRLSLNVVPLSLRVVLQAAVDTMQPFAQSRDVRLAWTEPVDADLQGDSGRLQQVFCNLLANAIKFAPANGGVVTVSARVDGGSAVVTVADNGAGFPAAFAPHLFERFRQADASTTRPHGGLGLGLAIVKELVEMHHGSVSGANCTDAPGAVFTIRLPVTPRPPAAKVAPAAGAPAGALDGVHVLVVDDDPDTLDVTAGLLRQFGATVTQAAGVTEALTCLRERRPDILLTDIAMPDEDGFTLLRRVRALSEADGGSIPAAALTARASPEDRRRALEAGFHAHITKPVQAQELLSTLAELSKSL